MTLTASDIWNDNQAPTVRRVYELSDLDASSPGRRSAGPLTAS